MMVPQRLQRRSARHGESGYARKPRDAYFTEPRCTEALLEHVTLPRSGIVWEPACGKGHIVKVLQGRGYRVHASDIFDHGGLLAGPAVEYGADFLTVKRAPAGTRIIATNPPFGGAEAFVRRALALAPPDGMVCMLLNALFDTASSRLDLFEVEPFRCKLVLTWRPYWVEERIASPRENYAWYVWDRSLRAPEAGMRWAR